MTKRREIKPARVPAKAKQAGETEPDLWGWVERAVWSDRMLEALEKGVKEYFQDLGYFSLYDAHCALLQSS